MRNFKLYVVTENIGKLKEIRSLLSTIDVEPVNIPKIEIQADKLEDVALYSAISAYLMLGKPLIVEDAGLFIKRLNGFPGVYSSFVFKTIGVNGILKLMRGVKDRRAYFKSVVAYADDVEVKLFSGIVYGVITEKPRGNGGFGFDPIFVPEGYNKTFAEMSIEEKNKVSHRGIALGRFKEWLLERMSNP